MLIMSKNGEANHCGQIVEQKGFSFYTFLENMCTVLTQHAEQPNASFGNVLPDENRSIQSLVGNFKGKLNSKCLRSNILCLLVT